MFASIAELEAADVARVAHADIDGRLERVVVEDGRYRVGSGEWIAIPDWRGGDAAAAVADLDGDGRPKLVVVRGQRMDVQYPLYAGKNYLGRTDDKPVDIDLDDQEAPDRIWTSRQHAVVTFENGRLTLEDLNSLNGTFVNRQRVHPGQVRDLHENDVIQVGTVHLKVLFG